VGLQINGVIRGLAAGSDTLSRRAEKEDFSRPMKEWISSCFVHESDETLEDYVRGKLSNAASERVETHLLLCETCQRLTEENDAFVSALLAAFNGSRLYRT
jgi:hypothetical protein